MGETNNLSKQLLFCPPQSGREYNMGSMTSIFYADGAQTENRYCVSTWWLEPLSEGSGPHSHDENEELFYVLEGTMTFRLGPEYVDAPKGSFIRVPAGVIHDFMNRSNERAGILNVFIPGGFEQQMPKIVQWYEENKK
ncbi:cupin domain-containing protein [Caldalkalibacillus horti]|uniref:Mannose-6-phosphate isomerase-like protein (Cupin superfamily) n=1 Tax=Caldalkalibacillus horti TaxID=77523 RepID=A0ABT9VWG2_9BACI|nr:cupin domain-containing protein [Bacillus horti]MDQ0165331.1 mannose-6-phosphate isomerase-like protein (cupin superfamily) [Bacillus horti]